MAMLTTARLLSYVKEKSVRELLFDGPRILLNHLYRDTESTWFSKSLFAEQGVPHKASGVTFRLESVDNSPVPEWVESHRDEYPWIYHPKEFQVARAEQHPYLTIFDKKKIIGFIKAGHGRVYIHDFDKTAMFPPGCSFIYDSLVIPEYRGRRIIGAAMAFLAEEMRKRGQHLIWAHIAHYNKASLKAFRRMGFVERIKIRYLGFANYGVYIRDGWRPFTDLNRVLAERSQR